MPAESQGAATGRARWLALAAASSLAAFVFGRTVVENDLFWHLAVGRYLVTSGFPRTDPFGVATEAVAWSPPEWLSEWLLFEVHAGGGLAALGAVHAGLVLLLGVLVFLRARELAGAGGGAAAFLAVVLAALPASVHLGIRPLLVGHVLSALVLLTLARDRRGPSLVPALPLVFVLWANLHPSWPLGVGWIALEVVGRLASGPLSRRFPARVEALPISRSLVLALALAPLAALVRPDGLDGWLYPFVHVIGLGDRMGEIIEWFPLRPTEPLHAFSVLLCSAALVIGARRRAALPDLLVALASSYLLIRHQRFLPLALIGVAPLLAASLAAAPSAGAFLERLAEPKASRVLGTTLALVACVTWPRPSELAASVDVLSPVGATEALARAHAAPRVLTTFEDGGYVAWRLPGARVWIDSRFDLFARAGVFDAYLALRAGGTVAPLLHHGFDAAILPTPERDAHFEHVRAELVGLGWREVFADENAVLLLPDRATLLGCPASSTASPAARAAAPATTDGSSCRKRISCAGAGSAARTSCWRRSPATSASAPSPRRRRAPVCTSAARRAHTRAASTRCGARPAASSSGAAGSVSSSAASAGSERGDRSGRTTPRGRNESGASWGAVSGSPARPVGE